MKKKIAKIIVSVLCFTAIPTFLAYVASSDYFLSTLEQKGWLGQNANIQLIKDVCLWISIILSAWLLSFNSAKAQINHEKSLEQRNLLLKMSKEILNEGLSKIQLGFSDFNIRIFIPKHPVLLKIAHVLHIKNKQITYVIKNIPQIADQGTTNNLEFKVFPEPQGLVGECYNRKSVLCDDNLENTNPTYKLNKHQLTRIANLKWSICCPIFDSSDDVIAILALDGKNKITINATNKEEIGTQIVVFSRMLYDAVPQLFRR